MANIFKTGIVYANGMANPNIIGGTSRNVASYTYPESSYSDKFVQVTKIIPSASQYTLSFYAKSTVDGDKVRAHYYNPNTTTRAESSQGVVSTVSDGNIDFTLSTKWTLYWVVYTQSETTAVKRVIFPRMNSSHGTGTVSVKMVKFEEGNVPTPWLPNSSDSKADGLVSNLFEIDDICKIHKPGYIQAYEFIET